MLEIKKIDTKTVLNKKEILKLQDLFNSSILEKDYMVSGEKLSILNIKLMLKNENICLFIIEENSILLGYAQFVIKTNIKEFSHNAKLNSIAIKPEYRGNKLSKKLLDKSIIILKKEKIKNIYLEVVTSNSIAITLYTSLGFLKTGTLHRSFKKNGEYVNIDIYQKFL